MLNRIYKWPIISLVFLIVLFSLLYNRLSTNNSNILIIYKYLPANETNTVVDSSSFIHPMFKDAEAKTCYSMRSLTMPEDIINLNAIAFDRQPIHSSCVPKEVTYDRVHSILYGDPSSKSIYKYTQKYFNKTYDQSYPHTYLKRDTFISIIRKLHPSIKLQFVVEVGSFTGKSSSIMGHVLKNEHAGSFLLCIDTWLGDLNMWINKIVWENLSVSEDGRPTVYYQFLVNIQQENLTKTVLPLSMSSILGARFLQTFRFHPQLIYLDSAHEQGETLIELSLYWNLLTPGGILFGDDWEWAVVRCDVKKFAYVKHLSIEHIQQIWILKKPFN